VPTGDDLILSLVSDDGIVARAVEPSIGLDRFSDQPGGIFSGLETSALESTAKCGVIAALIPP
jgi:hypothetical protein